MEAIISILFITLTILGTGFLCLLNWNKQEERIKDMEKEYDNGRNK